MVFVPLYRPYLCYLGGVDDPKSLNKQTAQVIPDASYADFYDETTMPPELHKTHQDSDWAVMLGLWLLHQGDGRE